MMDLRLPPDDLEEYSAFLLQDYKNDKKIKKKSDRAYHELFLDTDGETMDKKRLAKPMEKLDYGGDEKLAMTGKAIMRNLTFNARLLHDDYRPTGYAVLISLPHGEDQALHNDHGDEGKFEGM